MMYKQCKFKKDNVTAFAWIPENFARVGKVVRFKIDNMWYDGYRIEEVYSVRRKEEDAIEDSFDYEHQREASDI